MASVLDTWYDETLDDHYAKPHAIGRLYHPDKQKQQHL